FWICWLTAPGVTDSSSAARLKFRCRAAASKARRAFSGGRRRRVSINFPERRRRSPWLRIGALAAILQGPSSALALRATGEFAGRVETPAPFRALVEV